MKNNLILMSTLGIIMGSVSSYAVTSPCNSLKDENEPTKSSTSTTANQNLNVVNNFVGIDDNSNNSQVSNTTAHDESDDALEEQLKAAQAETKRLEEEQAERKKAAERSTEVKGLIAQEKEKQAALRRSEQSSLMSENNNNVASSTSSSTSTTSIPAAETLTAKTTLSSETDLESTSKPSVNSVTTTPIPYSNPDEAIGDWKPIPSRSDETQSNRVVKNINNEVLKAFKKFGF